MAALKAMKFTFTIEIQVLLNNHLFMIPWRSFKHSGEDRGTR